MVGLRARGAMLGVVMGSMSLLTDPAQAQVLQPLLTCTVQSSAGFQDQGGLWRDAPDRNADVFQLKPVPGRVCENDDFTCQAENPNYHLTSAAMGGDFVGCYRHAFLSTMTCDVFTSVLLVNFEKGVFSLMEDDGLIGGDEPNGAIRLRTGRCAAAHR